MLMTEIILCRFVYVRGQTLAERGTDEVDAQLPDDFRKSFTAIATITAAGGKLPPIFLAQGKTNACHKQFEGMLSADTDYEIFHSSCGNTTEEVMIFYLEKVHAWMNGMPCALIMDRYSSHICESTLKKAEELGITLVFIPTSATDKYQTLDLRVFGTMKLMASKEFDDFVFKNNRGYSKPEAADLFIRIWKKLSHEFVVSTWTFNEEDSDEASPHTSDTDFQISDSEYYINSEPRINVRP